MNRPALSSRIVVNGVLVLTSLYFLLPLWWLIVATTKAPGAQFTGGLWFDGFHLAENVAIVNGTRDGIFWQWMLNSVLYAGVAALVGTLIAAACGFALAKYRFRGREVVFGTVLAAVLIPKILFTVPLFLMFSGLGLLGGSLAALAVILPSAVSPFGVYLARVFAAQSVPDELLEAARIDGSSEFSSFVRVAMPIMMPSLVTIFLFQFVEVWNNFLLPAMLLPDASSWTVAVGLVAWSDSNGQVPAGTVVVAAAISVVPLIIAFLGLQRFWRAGLTAGALK